MVQSPPESPTQLARPQALQMRNNMLNVKYRLLHEGEDGDPAANLAEKKLLEAIAPPPAQATPPSATRGGQGPHVPPVGLAGEPP